MSIFEQNPTSLKAFKDCLQVGQKMRLVYTTVPNHIGVGLLREVARKQTGDLVFKLLEGERAGRESYMTWPKATELLFLRDARGFFGFTVNFGDGSKDVLTYHFEPENKAHAMTDEQLKHIAPMSLVSRPDLGLIGSEEARAELVRRVK